MGDESIIKPVLEKQDTTGLNIRIVDAPEMLTMEDKGEKLVLKARSKDAKNSMAVGIDLVKSGGADAFVTAGNTRAHALCSTLEQTQIANLRTFCNLVFWEVSTPRKCVA